MDNEGAAASKESLEGEKEYFNIRVCSLGDNLSHLVVTTGKDYKRDAMHAEHCSCGTAECAMNWGTGNFILNHSRKAQDCAAYSTFVCTTMVEIAATHGPGGAMVRELMAKALEKSGVIVSKDSE